MPVANIVDHRTNKYLIDCDIVIEPSWHDNSIQGSTKFKKDERQWVIFRKKRKEHYVVCESLYDATIEEAIRYVNRTFPKMPMTMYIYDKGSRPDRKS